MTARDGGDEPFRSMYHRYYARVLAYFRREFRLSKEDAEELAQDTFVRFYRMRDYRGEAEWGLLETIARNVAYNHARSLTTLKRGAVKTESMSDLEASQQVPTPPREHPLDRLIEEERKERLRQAILTLPKGEQRCLRLRLEDWDYGEIARTLRISIDAVKSRIRDAKRLLRERLGDEGALPEEES